MADKAPQFSAIDRSKIWMQVARQIEAMIDNGEFVPGAKLPSERELCTQFGVSRMSIREALRKLQVQSYIDVKPGLGIFVVEAAKRSSVRLNEWMEMHSDSLQKLIELRLVLEPGIAELATYKATEKTVFELRNLSTDLADAETEKASDIDGNFHRLLASLTENSMIVQIVNAIIDATDDLRHITLIDKDHTALASRGHLKIVDAMAAKDAEGAATAMRQHLDDARTSLQNSNLRE